MLRGGVFEAEVGERKVGERKEEEEEGLLVKERLCNLGLTDFRLGKRRVYTS